MERQLKWQNVFRKRKYCRNFSPVAFPTLARHFMSVNEIGKFLVIVGAAIAVIGALIWSGFGKNWLGRLPGDINYSKDNFSFHFPIVTCLILSVILTLLLWLFRK
jgi:uncharacterized protein YybS (DUF2232 family)